MTNTKLFMHFHSSDLNQKNKTFAMKFMPRIFFVYHQFVYHLSWSIYANLYILEVRWMYFLLPLWHHSEAKYFMNLFKHIIYTTANSVGCSWNCIISLEMKVKFHLRNFFLLDLGFDGENQMLGSRCQFMTEKENTPYPYLNGKDTRKIVKTNQPKRKHKGVKYKRKF